MTTYIQLDEDLVGTYSSGYSGEEELQFILMADEAELYDQDIPNESEGWW